MRKQKRTPTFTGRQSSIFQDFASHYQLEKLQRAASFSWAIWVKRRKIENWSGEDFEVRGVLLVKGEKLNWIVYFHWVGFEPICLTVEFPKSFPYLNTDFTITYLICLNCRPSSFFFFFLLNSLFKKEINNLNSNICFTC